MWFSATACEERFEAELHDIITRSLHAVGQLGVHVLRRVLGTGSREYGIVRRFSNPEFGDRFYRSSLLQQWELAVAQFTEGDRGARSCPARKPGSPCPASGR